MRRIRLAFWPSMRTVWVLVAIAALLAASPGVGLFVPLAWSALALLIAACVVDAVRLRSTSHVRITRVLPAHFALRRSVEVLYEIENRGPHLLRIGLVEAPLRTLDLGEDSVIVTVAPNARTRATHAALPVARGRDAFAAIDVWFETSLGLMRRRAHLMRPHAIRVYPDLSAVERYGSFAARNRLIEAGLRRMRQRGTGTEFESLREYGDGDAFRAIDWKATARRGKLMVVRREVERSQDVMILLDCGRVMTARLGDERKLDYAMTAALSVASIASLASDRVGVVAFARSILAARAPRAAVRAVQDLANLLCDVEPHFEESDYSRAFAYARSHLHRRSLVILFTDVIDPVAQATVLAELRSLAGRHVVLAVFMNDDAVRETIDAPVTSIDDAYRLDVALGLADERARAARLLKKSGVNVIDVPATRLTVAAIDEYLRTKMNNSV